MKISAKPIYRCPNNHYVGVQGLLGMVNIDEPWYSTGSGIVVMTKTHPKFDKETVEKESMFLFDVEFVAGDKKCTALLYNPSAKKILYVVSWGPIGSQPSKPSTIYPVFDHMERLGILTVVSGQGMEKRLALMLEVAVGAERAKIGEHPYMVIR